MFLSILSTISIQEGFYLSKCFPNFMVKHLFSSSSHFYEIMEIFWILLRDKSLHRKKTIIQ